MKFLHISDLHLGRKFYNYCLLEIQREILEEIIKYIDENDIYGVFLCGDIYDKSVPVSEAVTVFDSFLTALSQRNVWVFMISGNHDSPERLQFGGEILKKSYIHIASSFCGSLERVDIEEGQERVSVYMLPFVRLSRINYYYPNENFTSLSDAVSFLIAKENIDNSVTNILIYHGFVLGNNLLPQESDSEIQLGGVQLLNGELFEKFDYVALGHIHRPQWVLKNKIRYSGSIMKYSFSECTDVKSMTLMETAPDKKPDIKTVLLPVKKDMKVISGRLDDLLAAAVPCEDFIKAELCDEELIPFANEKLREVYPYLAELVYVKQMEKAQMTKMAGLDKFQEKDMLELIERFLEEATGEKPDKETEEYRILEKLCREMEEKQ